MGAYIEVVIREVRCWSHDAVLFGLSMLHGAIGGAAKYPTRKPAIGATLGKYPRNSRLFDTCEVENGARCQKSFY